MLSVEYDINKYLRTKNENRKKSRENYNATKTNPCRYVSIARELLLLLECVERTKKTYTKVGKYSQLHVSWSWVRRVKRLEDYNCIRSHL